MLRDFIVIENKPAITIYKAAAAMVTGMAVQITDTAGTNSDEKQAKFVTAGTATNLYFTNKERIPVGINTARASHSDYDNDFNQIASGELVKLEKFYAGEEFLTDAKGTATKGKVVMAGTDGKLVNATVAVEAAGEVPAVPAVESCYLYVDDVVDNSHTLMHIRVLDKPQANLA